MKVSKEFVAGVIVLVTLGLFYWMFNYLKGNNLFDKGVYFYAIYDNINGLEVSRKVNLSGAQIGRVEKITPRQSPGALYPKFVVEYKIDPAYSITKNTIANIIPGGITGNAYVNLILEPGAELVSGDTLKGTISGGMFDQLTPTKDKLETTLVSLNETLKRVQNVMDSENQQNIKQMLRSLNATIASFQSTAQDYSVLANKTSTLLDKNEGEINQVLLSTDATLLTAQSNLNKIGGFADKLNQLELAQTMQSLKSSSDQLNLLLTKINNGEGTMGALMNNKELYNNLENASKNMDELLKDFKNHPNRYVQFSIFGKQTKQKPIE